MLILSQTLSITNCKHVSFVSLWLFVSLQFVYSLAVKKVEIATSIQNARDQKRSEKDLLTTSSFKIKTLWQVVISGLVKEKFCRLNAKLKHALATSEFFSNAFGVLQKLLFYYATALNW